MYVIIKTMWPPGYYYHKNFVTTHVASSLHDVIDVHWASSLYIWISWQSYIGEINYPKFTILLVYYVSRHICICMCACICIYIYYYIYIITYITLRPYWFIEIWAPNQMQPFVDVLQTSCSQKFRNIRRKTPFLETLSNFIIKETPRKVLF